MVTICVLVAKTTKYFAYRHEGSNMRLLVYFGKTKEKKRKY